jgi:thiosulfate/3-mercaptopyruvate sulfurtransferase
MSDTKPVVDVAWLASQRPADVGGLPIRIVDLRWTLAGKPTGREKYEAGHIPGAAFVDLDRDLSRHGGPGRHPFPEADQFADVLARLGIGPETHVVVYDDSGGAIAARLWFMLRVHGHERASVLDGGYPAWAQAGLPVTKQEPRIEPAAKRTMRLDRGRLVDRAYVERMVAQRRDPGARPLLTDARPPERYRGETEPIDRVAGHIPGAVNAPVAGNLREGRFRPPQELRALYERLGAGRTPEIVASCGSGVTACHTLLSLELAGIGGGKLYAGSWSDWSSQPDAQIATGSDPG